MNVPQSNGQLNQVSIVNCSAEAIFRATEFFTESDQPDGIKILLSTSFKQGFLYGYGKIEHDVPAVTLNIYELRKSATNNQLIAELGGKDMVKTNLAYMAQLIRAQPQGQNGPLLTNGEANVFYVENCAGELGPVDCNWHSSRLKWEIIGNLFSYPSRWRAGEQFFSPSALRTEP